MASEIPTHCRKRNEPQPQGRGTKRQKTSWATKAGVFACFTLDGNDVNIHRRSAFSSKRKEEVKGIRRKGACLRCRLLKRACSGEDPCKTCITAARAAANSKALMWMECIRPSFQAINIFDQRGIMPDQARIDNIMNDLLNDDVYLDFHIPFELNVEAASSQLARWLSDDEAASAFSVVGVFSCSTNTNLLQNALDPNLGRDLRLFVHLTTHLYTTGMQGGYQQYTDQEIRDVRDCVGNRLLMALDPLLRPSEIEASENKLAKLRSLFLLLLGTIVGIRYTCSEVLEEPNACITEFECKQDALLRLLCHYLIYIGKATALLESYSNEKSLLQAWRTQWNKPAAFTWNSTQGLEMHYRIEPPVDWIVSSSEDESLSSIDIDLSEFDDAALFTQDSDLLKCTACGAFWTFLDDAGVCHLCRPTIQDDARSAQPLLFTDDIDFLDNSIFGAFAQQTFDFDLDDDSSTAVDVSDFLASTGPAYEEQSPSLVVSTTESTAISLVDPLQEHSPTAVNQLVNQRSLGTSPARRMTGIAAPMSDRGKRMRGNCWKCTSRSSADGLATSICQRCTNSVDRPIS